MQAAGLTHGGFYKHFGSRDDLVAEAVERALADERGVRSTTLTAGADDPLAAFVDWYTSADHRDNPATGCAVVALGADAPRADDARARRLPRAGRALPRTSRSCCTATRETRRRATVALSTLVGAVLVARAVDDAALSEEILRDVREAVKAL